MGSPSIQPRKSAEAARANFLIRQAFELEEEEGEDNAEEAIELYLSAAEVCIKGQNVSYYSQGAEHSVLAGTVLKPMYSFGKKWKKKKSVKGQFRKIVNLKVKISKSSNLSV